MFFKKYFYHKKNDFIQFILSDIFIARIAIVLISIGIILTKSRSGNTTFLVILIFYFALDYLRNKKLTFTSKIIISIFFIDIFLINYFVGLNQVISRFAEINYTNEELRIDTFQFSFSNLKNFLFFGYGLGNFESLFRLEIGLNNYFYDHVHNDYLEFFGELGLIGSLIFFIIFIKFTRYIINFQKLVFLKDQFFLIFLACAIHGLFDFALHMPSIIYVTVFLFGLSSCKLKRSIIIK